MINNQLITFNNLIAALSHSMSKEEIKAAIKLIESTHFNINIETPENIKDLIRQVTLNRKMLKVIRKKLKRYSKSKD